MKEATTHRFNAFKDPLCNFLFSKWQHYFAIILFSFSLQILISFFYKTLTEFDINSLSPEKAHLLDGKIISISTKEDLPIFFVYFIAVCLFFFLRRFFLYLPEATHTLFMNGVFIKKKGSTRENVSSDYNEMLQGFEKKINAHYMYIPAFSLFWLVIVFFVRVIEPIKDLDILFWNDFHFFPVSWILLITVSSLMWFMVGIFMWKMYCVVAFVRKLAHEYEVDLNPYNADGFGGFGPLSQVWINMALAVVLISLFYAAVFLFHYFSDSEHYYLWQKYFDLTVFILYTLGIIAFLLYPMKKYHEIVKDQKSELFRCINSKNDRFWKMVREPLFSDKDEDQVRSFAEQSVICRQLSEEVRKIPSWPFTPPERISIFLIASIPWILRTIGYFK
ncbi:MAG: hypothetical protein HXS54_07985 [Theionarchaea archaeon]|nr:hypothetical protein [Theionarchaea archaeon]